jgi:HD-GYP domain-containing protein (c-di-GMP phosphodiesterase class II)
MLNENSQPVQNLQRAIIELNLAYEATVEGFARALETREGEPIGHTHQVTEITSRLAKVVGVGDELIPHLRRGALLHDIGKLGIPESILHKTETLTDDEWKAIRLHPQIAYALLSPIVYLLPALDIPYCHHEKWDGSGYPQGLKGNHIPLAARIFAVVDVWDALISDRPFRKAWSDDQASNYMREQAGSRFDPKMVDTFLNADIKKKVTKTLIK